MPNVSLEGENATTKTTIGYTAPLPIVGFQFDMGWNRALHGFRHEYFNSLKIQVIPLTSSSKLLYEWRDNGADITIYELPIPPQLDNIVVKGVSQVWDRFVALCSSALSDPGVASAVVDTMTLARAIKADAYLQSLQEKAITDKKEMRERLLQIEYGPANDAMRDIYMTAEGLGKNLVAIHHLTDEYAIVEKSRPGGGFTRESEPTGRKILHGWSKTYLAVDIAMRLQKVRTVQGLEIQAEFMKCGYDLSLESSVLNSPSWNSIMNRIMMAPTNDVKLPINERMMALTIGAK